MSGKGGEWEYVNEGSERVIVIGKSLLTEICCAEPKISKSFCVIFSKPPMV